MICLCTHCQCVVVRLGGGRERLGSECIGELRLVLGRGEAGGCECTDATLINSKAGNGITLCANVLI